MRKVLFGSVVFVVCTLSVIFLIIKVGIPEEPNAIKVLEEKGYTNIEVIDKKVMGVRDQYLGISSSVTIITVKAICPEGKSVRIRFSYCYPMGTEPRITIE